MPEPGTGRCSPTATVYRKTCQIPVRPDMKRCSTRAPLINDPLEDRHFPAVFVGNRPKGSYATVLWECAGFVSRMIFDHEEPGARTKYRIPAELEWDGIVTSCCRQPEPNLCRLPFAGAILQVTRTWSARQRVFTGPHGLKLAVRLEISWCAGLMMTLPPRAFRVSGAPVLLEHGNTVILCSGN